MIRLAGVVEDSITDGPGLRMTVFVQGCPHHCEGCHNPETWSFEGGTDETPENLFARLRRNPLTRGVTFSGGEPFCQPGPLAELGRMVHTRGLDVVSFSGYLYEELTAMRDPGVGALLAQTDILIDGPFILAQKDLSLRFRGSRNQRVIDMDKTRRAGTVVLCPEQ